MRTLNEIYQKYKHSECYGDKGTVHSYIEVYSDLFEKYRQLEKANVLEIGILNGSSLRMWEEYFHKATVYGVDIVDRPLNMADLNPMINEGTHHIHLLNATIPAEVEKHFSAIKFDVIVEDASHALCDQLSIYRNFRNKMSPGGIYVIEDVADLDAVRHLFENMDTGKNIRIIDRRSVKHRFDDVLVVITDSI